MLIFKKFSLLLLLGVFLPLSASAQDSKEDDIFRNVAKDLRCPTCTGLSILESDAKFSVQIKDEVKEQLAAGKNKKEILEFFTQRYGPWILREPPKEGFGLFAWAIPIGLLILGPILIWFFVWRHKVQLDTFGVRSNDVIIEEMNQKLSSLRGK